MTTQQLGFESPWMTWTGGRFADENTCRSLGDNPWAQHFFNLSIMISFGLFDKQINCDTLETSSGKLLAKILLSFGCQKELEA